MSETGVTLSAWYQKTWCLSRNTRLILLVLPNQSSTLPAISPLHALNVVNEASSHSCNVLQIYPGATDERSFAACLDWCPVAVLVFLLRDIIVYEIRSRRDQKCQLLDRRLSKLYAPVFLALKGGTGGLTNIYSDELLYQKFVENMHLLSPELHALVKEFVTFGGSVRPAEFTVHEQKRILDLSNQFSELFVAEFEALRGEYMRIS